MSISNTISSYRKRRKTPMPLIISIAAVVLVAIGIIIVVIGFSGGGGGGFHLFSTDTPTPTITPSPTNTNTPTETPTITPTFTETLTATPSEPYSYVVQQGDYLIKIATDHGLTESDIVLIFYLNPYNAASGTGIDPQTANISIGQTIQLPPPGMQYPTSTPWPTGIAPGTKITYFVMPGDSLAAIANKCNSTVDAIVAANKDTLSKGATTPIIPGMLLQVPVNLVTPTPTAISSATPLVTATP
jgi:LysM repeat protein